MDLNQLDKTYKEEFASLIEEYGNATAIPPEETYLAGEKLRAGYCIITQPNLSIKEAFRHYSVDKRVWHFYTDEVPTEPTKKVKRTDKYQSIIDWTKEHLFEQITPEIIMEVGDISYPTALKLINDRVDIFRKIKRGLYELRDPIADRNAQK